MKLIEAVKFKHSGEYSMYYCTFTCYKWLSLFAVTNAYDIVYNWFDILKSDDIDIAGYVIMPNHLHCILYFPVTGYNLNNLIGNAKRFMAYEIVNRLEAAGNTEIINMLQSGLTERDRRKGQLHRVFENSFDAKPVWSEKFLFQKLNYIHVNPVKGKWMLAKDDISYEHSSALFYETGKFIHYMPKHYKDI